jgi:hypothetical protein
MFSSLIKMTASRGRRATNSGWLVLGPALAVAAGCGGGSSASQTPPGVSTAATSPPVTFEYDSLDDRAVSGEAMRGKPTVVAFVTTGSLPSQAQVDFLVAMADHDADRTNYLMVALDPRENRELVELYRTTLHVRFPVAMGDDTVRAGAGPFGDVTGVPCTVVLDRAGRVAARVGGRVAKPEELRAALRGL